MLNIVFVGCNMNLRMYGHYDPKTTRSFFKPTFLPVNIIYSLAFAQHLIIDMFDFLLLHINFFLYICAYVLNYILIIFNIGQPVTLQEPK